MSEILDTIQSFSNPNKHYHIIRGKDGKVYCDCPNWIFKARKSDGICKHIAAYIKKGHDVVVYKLEEFLAVKRASPVLYTVNGDIERGIEVKRNRL